MAKTFFTESDDERSRQSFNNLPSVMSYKNRLITDMNVYQDSQESKRRLNSMDTHEKFENYEDQVFGKEIKKQTENMTDIMSEQYKRDYL